MKFSKSVTERIEEFRAEVNAFIDKEAAEHKKLFSGLPLATIRNSITSGIGCPCADGLKVAETIEGERT
jgi:hypothetical protein